MNKKISEQGNNKIKNNRFHFSRIVLRGITTLSLGCVLISCGERNTNAQPSPLQNGGVTTWKTEYSYSSTPLLTPSNVFTPTASLTPLPTSIPLLVANAISASPTDTCFITNLGGVKCLAVSQENTSSGQQKNTLLAVDVIGLTMGVKDISVGGEACVIMNDDSIKCWNNSTLTVTDRPEDVKGLGNDIADVVAGGGHNCVLTHEGGVKCWAWSTPGKMETSPKIEEINGLSSGVASLFAGNDEFCAVTKSGELKCWYEYSPNELRYIKGIPGGVTTMAIGRSVICVITTSHGVMCQGQNEAGQLGIGNTKPGDNKYKNVLGLDHGVATIAAGDSHVCSLSVSGRVQCWGANAYGQLGDGTTTNRPAPVDVIGLQSGVSAIVASSGYTCAMMVSGEVKCWGLMGEKMYFQASQPVEITAPNPDYSVIGFAVGYHHTCATIVNQIIVIGSPVKVKCWGNNQSGQLGNGTNDNSNIPVEVNMKGYFTEGQMVAGRNHTCAVNAMEGVICWGKNDSGQLGDNTTIDRNTPVTVIGLDLSGSTGRFNLKSLVAGGDHTCVLTETGGVQCWGNNQYGQLGDGTTINRSTPVKVTGLTSGVRYIVLGEDHTCALMDEGNVKCWGRNDSGQLGDGTFTNSSTPVDVSGLQNQAMQVVAGFDHTCAMTTGSPMMQCWGNNQFGQLGDGTTTNRNTPVEVTFFANGVWSNAIIASGNHTCATAASGNATYGWMCWGSNQFGQLGNGTTLDSITPVKDTNLPDISNDQTQFIPFESHGNNTCLLLSGYRSKDLKCWGDNSDGQLGDGTTIDRLTPVSVNGLFVE